MTAELDAAVTVWLASVPPSDDPVLGADRYPGDIELGRIETWPVASPADLISLMDYVKVRWSYPDRWLESIVEDYGRHREYRVSTGGWSGNEDLVAALEKNLVWAMMAPYEWRRGGHYVWRIPLPVKETTE